MDAQDSRTRMPRPQKPLTSSSSKNQYLIAYNAVSALLWLIVLGRVVTLVPILGTDATYPGVGQFTKWTQTLAFMEVVHAAFGIVRSPVATTAMQVASRLLLVWGVVDAFPAVATSPAYSTMLIAWSVTEVIRYSYFTLTLSGLLPGFVTWLRYNTFYVLYPLGISSECWLIWKATGPAGKTYTLLLQAILLVYIPGSYVLFTHMMTQRRKVLRANKAAKAI